MIKRLINWLIHDKEIEEHDAYRELGQSCQATHALYRLLLNLNVATLYVGPLGWGNVAPYVVSVKHKMKSKKDVPIKITE